MPEQVGKRVYSTPSEPCECGDPTCDAPPLTRLPAMAEGDYGYQQYTHERGAWQARPPGANLGSLEAHEVVENADGTITVSPSILILTSDENGQPKEEWHGFLQAGVWKW